MSREVLFEEVGSLNNNQLGVTKLFLSSENEEELDMTAGAGDGKVSDPLFPAAFSGRDLDGNIVSKFNLVLDNYVPLLTLEKYVCYCTIDDDRLDTGSGSSGIMGWTESDNQDAGGSVAITEVYGSPQDPNLFTIEIKNFSTVAWDPGTFLIVHLVIL